MSGVPPVRISYTNAWLSVPDQVAKLQARGLQIPDLVDAASFLYHVNYSCRLAVCLGWLLQCTKQIETKLPPSTGFRLEFYRASRTILLMYEISVPITVDFGIESGRSSLTFLIIPTGKMRISFRINAFSQLSC